MEEYMKRAVALIHQYVPPSAQTLQAAFQAGNGSLGESGPGTIQLQFRNYLLPGDTLTLSFNIATKVLTSVNASSYLDSPEDAVTLQVKFQTLPDGTNYPATTSLTAEAKKLQVVVQNSNYQRIGE